MTDHRDRTAVMIPEERLGPRAIRVEQLSGVVGAIGLLLCCAGFFANRAEFFQSYLFAFIYWGGFTIGGLGVLLMNHVVGGTWGVTTRRLLGAGPPPARAVAQAQQQPPPLQVSVSKGAGSSCGTNDPN